MDVGRLQVTERTGTGKTAAHKLRAAGLVPGVAYGHGMAPLLIAFDAKALKRSLDPQRRHNTLITMEVQGAGAPRELTVMLKEYDVDPTRRTVRHADFVVVREDQDVHVTVPLLLTGRAEGLKNGGLVHQVLREIDVVAKPHSIPTHLEIDITALDIGDSLHLRDLVLPSDVRIEMEPTQTLVTVAAPKAEKVTAEAAEAAEAAAAAAAAAPAEGGEKKAGGEAKAPAAEKKEKK